METANFGTFLREERERRQISLAVLSQSTKLSVSSLKLMEAGTGDPAQRTPSLEMVASRPGWASATVTGLFAIARLLESDA